MTTFWELFAHPFYSVFFYITHEEVVAAVVAVVEGAAAVAVAVGLKTYTY